MVSFCLSFIGSLCLKVESWKCDQFTLVFNLVLLEIWGGGGGFCDTHVLNDDTRVQEILKTLNLCHFSMNPVLSN